MYNVTMATELASALFFDDCISGKEAMVSPILGIAHVEYQQNYL